MAEAEARFHARTALARTGGDPESAHRHAAAMLAIAEKLRVRHVLAGALVANAADQADLGNLEAARHFYDRGLEVDPREIRLLSGKVQLEYEMGEFEQGALFLDRLWEVVGETGRKPTSGDAIRAWALAYAAYVAGEADKQDKAQRAARAVLSSSNLEPFSISLAWNAATWSSNTCSVEQDMLRDPSLTVSLEGL